MCAVHWQENGIILIVLLNLWLHPWRKHVGCIEMLWNPIFSTLWKSFVCSERKVAVQQHFKVTFIFPQPFSSQLFLTFPSLSKAQNAHSTGKLLENLYSYLVKRTREQNCKGSFFFRLKKNSWISIVFVLIGKLPYSVLDCKTSTSRRPMILCIFVVEGVSWKYCFEIILMNRHIFFNVIVRFIKRWVASSVDYK